MSFVVMIITRDTLNLLRVAEGKCKWLSKTPKFWLFKLSKGYFSYLKMLSPTSKHFIKFLRPDFFNNFLSCSNWVPTSLCFDDISAVFYATCLFALFCLFSIKPMCSPYQTYIHFWSAWPNGRFRPIKILGIDFFTCAKSYA